MSLRGGLSENIFRPTLLFISYWRKKVFDSEMLKKIKFAVSSLFPTNINFRCTNMEIDVGDHREVLWLFNYCEKSHEVPKKVRVIFTPDFGRPLFFLH